mmetsp:Transcript_31213/g.74191  ORF Transcript_31213/g.74191 Transcript_31213/m.74191 type:complete len:225 (+) Transcript_31213:703-1377(+)
MGGVSSASPTASQSPQRGAGRGGGRQCSVRSTTPTRSRHRRRPRRQTPQPPPSASASAPPRRGATGGGQTLPTPPPPRGAAGASGAAAEGLRSRSGGPRPPPLPLPQEGPTSCGGRGPRAGTTPTEPPRYVRQCRASQPLRAMQGSLVPESASPSAVPRWHCRLLSPLAGAGGNAREKEEQHAWPSLPPFLDSPIAKGLTLVSQFGLSDSPRVHLPETQITLWV